MTEFGTVTQAEEKHISMGQTRPHPRGRVPASPKFFGTTYLLRNGLTFSNKICYGNVGYHVLGHAPIPKGRGP